MAIPPDREHRPSAEHERPVPRTRLFWQLTRAEVDEIARRTKADDIIYEEDLGDLVCYQRSDDPAENPVALAYHGFKAELDFRPRLDIQEAGIDIGGAHFRQVLQNGDEVERFVFEYGIAIQQDGIRLVSLPERDFRTGIVSVEVINMLPGKAFGITRESLYDLKRDPLLYQAALYTQQMHRKTDLLR